MRRQWQAFISFVSINSWWPQWNFFKNVKSQKTAVNTGTSASSLIVTRVLLAGVDMPILCNRCLFHARVQVRSLRSTPRPGQIEFVVLPWSLFTSAVDKKGSRIRNMFMHCWSPKGRKLNNSGVLSTLRHTVRVLHLISQTTVGGVHSAMYNCSQQQFQQCFIFFLH